MTTTGIRFTKLAADGPDVYREAVLWCDRATLTRLLLEAQSCVGAHLPSGFAHDWGVVRMRHELIELLDEAIREPKEK